MSVPVRLVPLSLTAMDALLAGDLEAASAAAGVPLTAYILEHGWLWEIRAAQVRRDPAALDWIARVAVIDDVVVGHAGFHGPPDERGMVEVAYSVDPAFRRRGYATAMLEAAIAWASADPAVRTVRASISPDNIASLATLRPFGFVEVGEQWDEDDGLELLFELPVRAD